MGIGAISPSHGLMNDFDPGDPDRPRAAPDGPQRGRSRRCDQVRRSSRRPGCSASRRSVRSSPTGPWRPESVAEFEGRGVRMIVAPEPGRPMTAGIIPSDILDGPAAIRATLADATMAARDAADSWLPTRFAGSSSSATARRITPPSPQTALHGRMAGPADAVAIARTAGRLPDVPAGPRSAWTRSIGISPRASSPTSVATFEELRRAGTDRRHRPCPGLAPHEDRRPHRPVRRWPQAASP
jgi:hypothetical protein